MSTAPATPLLSDKQLEKAAALFRALGEPMRLRILQSVCRRPLAVNDIVEAVRGSQANVSKHLSLLAGAGILSRTKKGQRVFYGLKDQLVIRICALVHQR